MNKINHVFKIKYQSVHQYTFNMKINGEKKNVKKKTGEITKGKFTLTNRKLTDNVMFKRKITTNKQ